jgi:hypothetical protein
METKDLNDLNEVLDSEPDESVLYVSTSVIGHLKEIENHLANKNCVENHTRVKRRKYHTEDIFDSLSRATVEEYRNDHRPVKAGAAAPRRDCMRVKYVAACPMLRIEPEHDSKPIHSTCWRITCSSCKDKAITRIVKKCELRISAYQAIHQEGYGRKLQEDHVSFMFPRNKFTKELIRKNGNRIIWKEVDRLWNLYNDHPEGGAYAVVHLTKSVHDDGSSCHEQHCALEHHDEWEPHVHFFGFLHFKDSKEIREKERVIVRKHVNTWGWRSSAATIRYELGHCWTTTRYSQRKVVKIDTEGNSYQTTERVERSEECIHAYGVLSKRGMSKKVVSTTSQELSCRCGNE